MTREEARKSADNMTYRDAINNLMKARSIPYRKATFIKINELLKALEQKPCEDVMAIHTQGLEEGIRCAMCTNSTKNDRGCDGGCVVDNEMYKKLMEVINKQMFELITCKDCRHYYVDEDGQGYHCERDSNVRFSVHRDFFCADAERKSCHS